MRISLPGRGRRSARRWATRRPLIVGCIAAALLLVAALGHEAVTAGRAQRAVAAGVLYDYARLAADQYARSASIILDYDWFLPVLAQLPVAVPAAPSLPPVTTIDVDGQWQTRALAELTTRLFWLDLGSGELVTVSVGRDAGAGAGAGAGDREATTIREAVRADAGTRYDRDWSAATLFVTTGVAPLLLVYTVDAAPTGGADVARGFVAAPGPLVAAFESALSLYDLLPGTLTKGAGTGELVSVRVSGPAGQLVFQRGAIDAGALTAGVALGPRFAGISVEAVIPPAAALQLVAGGLPRSRLPVVVAMFTLAVALLIAGAALLRREQELAELREQFVAGASHELRTPLAQIRMATETLRLDRVRSPVERKRYFATLDREARRLTYLVDNLLQFSRSGERTVAFVPRLENVGRLASDIVAELQPLAAARGTRIEVELSEQISAVAPVDRDMLRQVLLNLLDNAIKYGPDGQLVMVRITTDHEQLELSVADQGAGVAPQERPRVWGRFWRGQAAQEVAGAGIGLALVKELVELHGGTVGVGETAHGGGRFLIRLPLAPTS